MCPFHLRQSEARHRETGANGEVEW
jgi:hypothetical protein